MHTAAVTKFRDKFATLRHVFDKIDFSTQSNKFLNHGLRLDPIYITFACLVFSLRYKI